MKLLRPYFSSAGPFTYNLGVASNFADPREFTIASSNIGATAAIWGSSHWGEAVWAGSTELEQAWQTVPDEYSMWKSLYLSVVARSSRVTYYGSDIIYTPGGNF